jgi:putative ABC transport system substrate-binding protein
MISRRQTPILGIGLYSSGVAAQVPGKVPRIGVISTADSTYLGYAAFREALTQLGYVEGANIHIEARFAAGQLDKLPTFATELVALSVDLIAVVGAITVRAVRQATTTIPTVFTVVLDPVADGLVPNAERPGGNITGATNFDPAQPRAQMRLLKQIVPGLSRVVILGDANVPELLDRANREAAEAEGLRPQNIRLRGPAEDLDAVFASIKDERAGALLGLEVPTVGLHAKRIIALATAAKLPTMFAGDSFGNGPMISYGSSLYAAARRMAGMVDRILKGASAGELPIEVVIQHRLSINLQVAREVGVTIPPEVLARAEKVIQ